MDDASAERARGRANWVGRLTTLEDQDDAAIVDHGTAAQRLAMQWRVTLDAWASSGRAMPDYSRANMPGRVIRASSD